MAYGFKNVPYLGPIIANIDVAADSSKVNVTYTNEASPGIELRNPNGFEVCFSFLLFSSSGINVFFRYVVLVNKFAVRMMQHG